MVSFGRNEIKLHVSDTKHPIYNELEIKKIDETLEDLNLDLGMPILESMIGFIKIASLTRFGTKGDFDAVTKENIKSKDKRNTDIDYHHHNKLVTDWVETCTNLLRNMLHQCSLATLFKELKTSVELIYRKFQICIHPTMPNKHNFY